MTEPTHEELLARVHELEREIETLNTRNRELESELERVKIQTDQSRAAGWNH